MWLTCRLVPDHKTIADFRKDNGPAIKQVCVQFIETNIRSAVSLYRSNFSYRQQTLPGPAPRPFVWTAQVAVVGQGVGASAPLIIAPSPVARHTVATILARGFSHLLGRGGGGFIRVADCRRRYDRTCSVRGIEGCRR